ncbi:hypothetical protein [Lutibacter sp.]
MKTISKFLLLSLSIIVFISCQSEINSIEQSSESETLNAAAGVASLVQRTVSQDGSKDNIIDKASCITVTLPVTVSANGVEITVENESDLELIEQVFDEFDDDDDILEIAFPIVITLSDYTEITVNNIEELQNLASECKDENEVDDDIECIDFVYPITLSKYDANSQLIETIVVNSDMQFYALLNHLDDGNIISINFPITMKLYDGTEEIINNMDEMGNLMNDAEFMCDEDDDNDYDDDDCMYCTENQISELLQTCSWDIHKIIINDIDKTAQYTDFTFTFLEDGTVKTIIAEDYIYGTWELSTSQDGMGMGNQSQAGKYINIYFENYPDFSFNWMVYGMNDDNEIDLRVNQNRLTLEKVCDNSDDNEEDDGKVELINILNEGTWLVANFKNDGESETANYNDFVIDFKNNSLVTATKGSNTIEGSWSVFYENEKLKLELNFGESMPFNKFNENWLTVDIKNTRVEVNNLDDSGNEESNLVFERI